MGLFDFFKKDKKEQQAEIKQDLDKGLEKTKGSFFDKIAKAVAGKSTVDFHLKYWFPIWELCRSFVVIKCG
jgi:hypothetical protein